MRYDVYERHAVVAQLLREALGERHSGRVLDVGGRSELLERFTPRRVLSVNVDGSSDMMGSGEALPFPAASFVAVVSIDTLEHLPRQRRRPFVRECLRVARRCVIIAAPFGSSGHTACERRLDERHRAIYGRTHVYLSEHVRYGLPDIAEIDALFKTLEGGERRVFFAGDYVWQARLFERAIDRLGKPRWVARVEDVRDHLTSLALFHPVQLRQRPYEEANRFYLLIEKQQESY
jgi:SAM-dependent methyltransferase